MVSEKRSLLLMHSYRHTDTGYTCIRQDLSVGATIVDDVFSENAEAQGFLASLPVIYRHTKLPAVSNDSLAPLTLSSSFRSKSTILSPPTPVLIVNLCEHSFLFPSLHPSVEKSTHTHTYSYRSSSSSSELTNGADSFAAAAWRRDEAKQKQKCTLKEKKERIFCSLFFSG